MRVVIVGNGIAGNEAANTLRRLSCDAEITILSSEKHPGYNPGSLPYFVAGDVTRAAVFLERLADYEDKNIDLILDSAAAVVDPSAKVVTTKKGEKYSYDKLVLAYGLKPFIPPIEGLDKKGVFGFKRLDEADRLFGQESVSAVVIGSGSVGIEVAEALKRRGCEVTVIELLDRVLPGLFDKPAADRIENALREGGIQVLTGEKVESIIGRDRVSGVKTDRREIPCRMVIVAAGMVPDNSMAEAAGIEVSRAVKVNRKMETNIPDIYACGDCVESVDFSSGEPCMYPFKHNAVEQARVAARNILGQDAVYPGAYLFARLHFFATYAAAVGKTSRDIPDLSDVEIIDREKHDGCLRVLLKGGRVVGAQAVGVFADHIGLFLAAMWRRDNMAELHALEPWSQRRIGFILGPGS